MAQNKRGSSRQYNQRKKIQMKDANFGTLLEDLGAVAGNIWGGITGLFGGAESGRGSRMQPGNGIAEAVNRSLQQQQGRKPQPLQRSTGAKNAPKVYGVARKVSAPRNPYGPGWRPDMSPGFARANRPSAQIAPGPAIGPGSGFDDGGYSYDPPPVPQIDFGSLLDRARGMVGDMGLSQALDLYKNQETDLRQRAEQSDARIAAMYDSLRKSILNESGNALTGAGDTAQQRLSDANAQQVKAIQDAYKTTQGTQNDILNRLGIGDANVLLANRGNQAGRYMEDAVKRAADMGAAEREYSAATNQNALANNTTQANAVGLEGTGRRADVQGQLGSLLAQLADRRSQAQVEFNNAAQQAALSLANQLYGQEMDRYNAQYGQWGDVQGLMRQDDRAAQDYAFNLAQMEADRQQMLQRAAQDAAELRTKNAPQPTPWGQLSRSQQFDQQIQRQYPDQASAISQALTRGGGNLSRLIQELNRVGVTGPNAQAIASQFLRAYGYQT